MKPHKRNGKAARLRRQESAQARRVLVENAVAAQMFGDELDDFYMTACMERGKVKSSNEDCQTPHCVGLREEAYL